MMKEQQVPNNVKVVDVEMKQFVLHKEDAIYVEVLNEVVGSGRIRLPELDVLNGGLGAIKEDLEMLKRDDLAGRKLVVTWNS